MSTDSCLPGPIEGLDWYQYLGRYLRNSQPLDALPKLTSGRRGDNNMAADRTIHIVDDDARFRTALQRLLQAAGFGTVQYGTPQAFLDAAPGLAGRCVLLDVRMPGIDGLQILERMRRARFPYAGHSHHRLWRHPYSGAGAESGSMRFYRETFRR